jgi:hypothetical protein
MANKSAITFFLFVYGDGSSTTLVVDLNTAPTCFLGPAGSPLSPNFSLGSLLLSGFSELVCSSGQTVTATHLLNVVTFTFGSAIDSGTTSYISGKLLF